MMNNNLKFGAFAMAALALTACSSEELIDNSVANNAKEISFSVSSELTTRGQQSYCNSNLPGEFTVLAKYNADNGIYFDKQTATKNGAAWTLGSTAYWPEEALDFVAWKNANINYDYNNGQPKFTGFTPAEKAGDQLDFIYAVTPNKTSGQVKLNFRHALSQIVFRADNASDLDIQIKGVKVGKVHSSGDFTLPALSTEKNYENHGNAANGTEANVENQGEWANVTSSVRKDYTVEFAAKEIGTDIVWLTEVNHNDGGDLSMLLLPQEEVNAWDPTVKGDDFNGAYFALDVIMTNADGKQVYAGEACVPATINWEQGVRYIYTFHFTDGGNGGWTPNPDDPQPVLTNITFDLSTDDFKPADNNQNVNAGETVDPNPEPEPAKTVDYSFTIPSINYEKKGTVEEGKTVEGLTVPTDEPTKEGYNFEGWSTTDGDDAVVEYKANDEIELTYENPTIVLYPVWSAKDVVYTVTFNANGGTLSSKMQESYTVNGKYGEKLEFTIPKGNCSKDHGNFKGWTLDMRDDLPVGSAAPADAYVYNQDENGNPTTKIEVNGNITLYAVYAKTQDGGLITGPEGEGEVD